MTQEEKQVLLLQSSSGKLGKKPTKPTKQDEFDSTFDSNINTLIVESYGQVDGLVWWAHHYYN